MLEIIEGESGRPAAGDAGQTDATGLMAVIADVVDVVAAVEPGEQLEQETGLVGAAATEIPEGFRRWCRAGFATIRSSASVQAIGWKCVAPGRSNSGCTSRPLCSSVCDVQDCRSAMACSGPECGGDRVLQIAHHRLQRFDADLWKLAGLVHHAALLTAHAERAQLLQAFFYPHGAVESPWTAFTGFAPSVADGQPTPPVFTRFMISSSAHRVSGFFRQA